jgi:hypothetical protein
VIDRDVEAAIGFGVEKPVQSIIHRAASLEMPAHVGRIF